jgi:hypothetical protein
VSGEYVYIRSEPGLWTVGFYGPDDKWEPESDHDSTDKAAARVRYLNGGIVGASADSLSRRVAQLEGALRALAAIAIEKFSWNDQHPDRELARIGTHTLYVRDVLAARAALKGQG